MRKKTMAALIAVVLIAGCATMASDVDYQAKTVALLKASFHSKGQAAIERLDQDEAQALCSRYAQASLPKEAEQKVEQAQLAAIKYPADGNLLGDWKSGEKIAQTGTGLQFSDAPGSPAGGNCYACHQIAPQELAYGTIGPSLYHFGKVRGYGVDVQRYVYGKIFNADAFAACSNMPRFGHNGILNEQQLRDVTALLMDPSSPVNQ